MKNMNLSIYAIVRLSGQLGGIEAVVVKKLSRKAPKIDEQVNLNLPNLWGILYEQLLLFCSSTMKLR